MVVVVMLVVVYGWGGVGDRAVYQRGHPRRHVSGAVECRVTLKFRKRGTEGGQNRGKGGTGGQGWDGWR